MSISPRWCFLPLSGVVCLLGACQHDYKYGEVDSVGGFDPTPNIVVSPTSLLYETLPVGDAATQSFNILNDGDGELQISGLDIYGSTAFSLITDSSSFALAPGESRDVSVVYTALGADDLGTVHIHSDDPGNPEPIVSLEGSGAVPDLLITPEPLSYGKVLVGCSRDEPIRLQNIGEADLVIDTIVQIGNGWTLDVPFDLPTTLAPGAATEVTLTVTAVEGDMDSDLWVSANDAVGVHEATQTATGVVDPSVEEEFWQGDGPYEKGDILFYVDQSCSMLDNKAIINANFESFAARLDSLDLDWQVGVAIRDGGCFKNGILTPDTPSLIAQFVDAVNGYGGDNTEAGLTITESALEKAASGGCNEGFLRAGSKVTLVEVSDETEQSARPWNTYVDAIQAMAPTSSITAIAGDVPDGCGMADPGTGYYEASVATGGAFLSICATDWSSYFETIANMAASGLLASFHLASEPQPESIVVQVDGSTVTDWTYDADTNSIVFGAESVPPPGSHIVVYFELAGDCAQ
jgi:hypothetical protein